MMICLLSLFSFLFAFFDSLFIFFGFSVLLYCCFYYYGGFFDGFIFLDFMSLVLVFVSVWVFYLSILSMDMKGASLLLFFSMGAFSIFSFVSSSYLLFYVCFEVVFIFMFSFLLGWGLTAERYQASFYMFFYTMVFSLPFLYMLMECLSMFSSIFFLSSFFFYDGFVWVFMFLVFVVKLPLFGFHLWLPKAHVEAPVSGSMVLAGVLLKLGGYGLIRFFPMLSYLSYSSSFFISFLLYLSLFGGLLVCFICVRQMDLKSMIAYSSVVHMSVMFSGILSFSFQGLYGSIFMMVAHGFISPLLFYLMNFIYQLNHSRSILVLKGLLVSSSLFCLFWFLSCSLNLSVPPFMSFFSEVLIIMSLSLFSFLEWLIVGLCCFFTGVYCIYMYVVVSHGSSQSKSFFLSMKDFYISVCHIYFVLLFPLVFFYF